ncbi:hypothetical protein WJX72_010085 [[Myrmecia] bisecta]|uniref:Uncharacterized protein n=1 Tax=[Myrmecia] bisecta TaxID=41462 RepID=A0AAW1PH75_9CHLO
MEEDALLKSVIEFHDFCYRLARYKGQGRMKRPRLTCGDPNTWSGWLVTTKQREMEPGTVDASLCTACHKVQQGPVNTVKALLDAGADREAVGNDHQTALMLAVEKQLAAAVEMLVAQGANVNATCPSRRGEDTVLHTAFCEWRTADGGHDIASILLDHGADRLHLTSTRLCSAGNAAMTGLTALEELCVELETPQPKHGWFAPARDDEENLPVVPPVLGRLTNLVTLSLTHQRGKAPLQLVIPEPLTFMHSLARLASFECGNAYGTQNTLDVASQMYLGMLQKHLAIHCGWGSGSDDESEADAEDSANDSA